MTTMAFRNGILASDRYVTGGGTLLAVKTKIAKVGNVLVGATGAGAVCHAFILWAMGGCKGNPPETRHVFGDNVYEGTGILILPGKPPRALTLIEAGWQDTEADPYVAFGSGADNAMGAMSMGASAAQAVEAAAKHDLATGGGIDVVCFH